MIVYKATNISNNKVYIGKTKKTLNARQKEHIQSKRKSYFKSAMLKYGVDSFVWEIVDTASCLSELNTKEIEWIAFYKSNNANYGYNLTKGGEGTSGLVWSQDSRHKASIAAKKRKPTMLGKKHSKETRKKMSKAAKGRTVKQSTREKLRQVNTGKKLTSEHRAQISKGLTGHKSPMKGKPLTDEHRSKISKSLRGRKHTKDSIERMKSAKKGVQISDDQKKYLSDYNKGSRKMTNGKINKYVHRDQIDDFLKKGFTFTKKPK